MGFRHNVGVMLQDDERLVRWASRNRRAGVTLGQLVVLLELVGSASVAELGGPKVSRAVNYRQKLARLEAGLGLGPLTDCVGGSTRLNRAGEQVAGELRLLFRELSALDEKPVSPRCRWSIGAGDAWLQGVIVPALAAMPANTALAWDVCNLRAGEVVRSLKEGRLHFGFLRAADFQRETRLTVQRSYRGTGLELVVGHAAAAPNTAPELVSWLIKCDRCLVQQGSTWPPLREQLAAVAGLEEYMRDREPAVACETHMQAATAAIHSGSWCIIPTKVADLFSAPHARRIPILPAGLREDMVLVVNSRNNEKLPNIDAATRALTTAIDNAMSRTPRAGKNR